MGDLQVLQTVRNYLIQSVPFPRVHFAIPPQAEYPLVLLEMEEMWAPYPGYNQENRTKIMARMKFKLSTISQNPGVHEATELSGNIRNVLEGRTIPLSDGESQQFLTLRFIACVTETCRKNNPTTRTIHHFYDSILRG